MTKSVRYQYDIEYVKHYNYYDTDFDQDEMADRGFDENQNCTGHLELPESVDEPELTDDDFCEESADDVPELDEEQSRSFSFVRVSVS